MKKIYKKNQLLEVNNIPSEVIESIVSVKDFTYRNTNIIMLK